MVPTDEIFATAENVFVAVLGGTVKKLGLGEWRHSKLWIAGTVAINEPLGNCKAVVVLQATKQFASFAACEMLAISQSEVTLVDRQDAISELTNLIGGSIKPLLPSPSVLSLPAVSVEGICSVASVTRSERMVENAVAIRCDGQPCRVVLRSWGAGLEINSGCGLEAGIYS